MYTMKNIRMASEKYVRCQKGPSAHLESLQTVVVNGEAFWTSASKQLSRWKLCKYVVELLGCSRHANHHYIT